MKPGFSTIMSAQFFSSLADNALFVVAVELLRRSAAHEWQSAALVPMFALFYVLLAPFVGAFADARPKGGVMFMSNTIKLVGCLLMMYGSHPLLSYAIVGLGAAAYSPAKYGILTELLPPSLLVKANGWIEGLTISSIILGVVLGGLLVSDSLYLWLLELGIPGFTLAFHDSVQAALGVIVLIYALAAGINIFIPRTAARLRPMWKGSNLGVVGSMQALMRDFLHSNNRLWQDKLGQISLATTTLFWGASGNLRYIVLAWSALVLGLNTTQSSSLLGVVAIGTAVGAVVSSARVKLEHATSVLPVATAMGLVVILMHWVDSLYLAIPILVLVGVLGGYMVVPMNALLQHRGHSLMGAGRSIAVQNFNEQACILLLGIVYATATKLGLSARAAMTSFGVMVLLLMMGIDLWHRRNLRRHGEAISHDLEMIRQDHHRQD
ncbi:lysophospholipid transporter LplT [Corticibacter populi]|uniref:Lysophospholipid transporter LplT n=1 Tax=Corticibacter populi TaxID=1550736 RepID=A0A3M6QJ03_9BURK|nr:lysophospholipid transporter LplT [Corticibacter populi]RMX03038.1 lysophospholipid transporter LplT [Corticibacter populi]RZS33474.1 MFS transporter [Corticibacter populi]